MNKLEELKQAWKCHKVHPVDCKNCPYFSGNSNKKCCAELKYDTFTFISDMMKAEQERMSVNEIMARFFD